MFRYEMLLFLCYFVFRMKSTHTIEIKRYTDTFKKQWDAFVDEAKNSTFLFRRDFMEYHKDRFEDFSLMLFVNDQLEAVLPACKVKDKVISHKGLTYGGLLVRSSCKFNLFERLFSHLTEYLKQHDIHQLEIKSLPTIYGQSSSDEISYLCSLYNGSFFQSAGSVIYLKKEKIISKSIFRNAKNAQRKGVVIRETNAFDIFWNDLLIPRLEERYHKKPIHSLKEIKYLKEKFPDEIILIGAFLEEEMIAGTVLFQSKTFVKSQYIGSKTTFNKLGAIDLLHLEMINNLKQEYFDFGTSIDPETGTIHNGLLAWKEQFGARILSMPTYLFNIL